MKKKIQFHVILFHRIYFDQINAETPFKKNPGNPQNLNCSVLFVCHLHVRCKTGIKQALKRLLMFMMVN